MKDSWKNMHMIQNIRRMDKIISWKRIHKTRNISGMDKKDSWKTIHRVQNISGMGLKGNENVWAYRVSWNFPRKIVYPPNLSIS